jgi:polygalacturonase
MLVQLLHVKRLIKLMINRKIVFVFLCFAFVCNATSQSNKLPVVQVPVFKKDSFNIIKYGAIADGKTLNTKRINDAIIACNKKGGGVVVIPPGLWLTGPVELLSNVNLYLQKNTLLQFTNDLDQYKLVEGNWEGVAQMRNQSPLSATNATNIAITGFGIIDGNGDAWRMVKKDKLNETQWKKLISSGGVLSDDKKTWYPSEGSLKGSKLNNPGVISADKSSEFYKEIKNFLRPNLLVLTSCKKILLEGVTFQNSPAWNLHPLMCENLTVRNVYAKNPWYAQNGDGIDVESCKNVLIENSTFDVGDDGICIKSGRDAAGRKRGMPTENLLVRNCTVYHAHGGFVIGSEMSGGAKNLYVEKCTFIGTDIGLRFKTTRGRGGIVENIYINNISMKDVVAEAILFDMYYEAKDPVVLVGEKREAPKVVMLPVNETTPQFRNFYVSNIICNGAEKAVFIRGLPEMHVQNVELKNMVIQARHGIEMSEATGITFKNIEVITPDTNPLVDVLNSSNVTFDKLKYPMSAELLFRIGGDRTNNISVTNTNVSDAKQKSQFEFGAKKEVLKIK